MVALIKSLTRHIVNVRTQLLKRIAHWFYLPFNSFRSTENQLSKLFAISKYIILMHVNHTSLGFKAFFLFCLLRII